MHCPLNYGAILQTYALQAYLESLGLKPRVINYRPDYIVCDQSLMYVGGKQYRKNILTRWAYRIMKAPSKFIRKRKFAEFGNNELHLTEEFKTLEEVKGANLNADCFICGSDQIWNVVSGAHKDPAYFLDFAPSKSKRISYAASGNIPLNEEVRNITLPMINRIDSISMREDSTIASIQPYVNKPISHVCDPVFLLEAEEWRKLYKKSASFKPIENYVLVYAMGNGYENTIQKARELANKENLPLYQITASLKNDGRIDKHFNISPYDFLALIDNANFVVTNSFHGTSFSIILQKQFWSCIAEGSNQRIVSLLEKAGMSDRLLDNGNKTIPSSVVDFSNTQKNLLSYILESKKFLQRSINEYE